MTAYTESSKRRRMHRRLVVEELERRIAPAGNVLAFMKGECIVIIGDDAGNDIKIWNVDLDHITIESGPNPTTINWGGGFSSMYNEGMKIIMGGGDDTVVLNCPWVEVWGNLSVKLGPGVNSLTIDSTKIYGSLDIKGDSLSDSVTLTGFSVTKGTKIQLGDGDNAVAIATFGTQALSVTLGNGDDTVNMMNPGVGANFQLKCGGGNDALTLLGAWVVGSTRIDLGDGANTALLDRFACPGSLQIKGKSGVDGVAMTDFNVGGNAKIDLGGGANALQTGLSVQPGNNIFGGKLDVKAKEGIDDVEIADTNVTGNAKISLGDGDNILSIPNVTNPCEFASRLSIQTKNGDDDITIASAAVAGKATIKSGNSGSVGDVVRLYGGNYSSPVTVQTGAGTDTVAIWAVTTGNEAAVKVKTGANADSVTIDDSIFGGDVSVDTGADVDVVEIETQAFLPLRNQFNGSFLLKCGAGVDVIAVGVDSSLNQSADFAASCVIDGGKDFDMLDMGINAATLNGNTFAIPYILVSIDLLTT